MRQLVATLRFDCFNHVRGSDIADSSVVWTQGTDFLTVSSAACGQSFPIPALASPARKCTQPAVNMIIPAELVAISFGTSSMHSEGVTVRFALASSLDAERPHS